MILGLNYRQIRFSISERYTHKTALYSSEITTNTLNSERYTHKTALYSSENIEYSFSVMYDLDVPNGGFLYGNNWKKKRNQRT